MADLVIRATLRDNVLPQLAKIAAAVEAVEKQMAAHSKRVADQQEQHHKKTNQNLLKIDDSIRHTARRMASRVLLIAAAIAAAAGHAVALTGALWPMIGALGAIPAIAVGGVAGIAALIVGFSGLGAAMKKTGGGASQSADQIASAQRRIEVANRSLRDSQEALNDAWEEARDKLRDIQTQYAGSKLDVEAAALAVRDAELALREARSSGDRQERARADLALRQAQLALVEAQNLAVDVEQEYQEVMAAGVEGSDEVRDATERQADALYELAQAQKALADAQKGGGGASAQAEAYAKLSLAGKALVDTFKALAPAWRQVQRATQQALLTGVAEDVRKLSDSYLPVMLRQLPAIATGWNNAIRSMSGVATQADFVKDMDDSLGLMAIMWQRVGNSFGPFLDGFRQWVRIGADFMPRLGSWIQDHARKWQAWSREVRETGRGFRWIENALITGHKFNELIKSWGRSLFEVFRLGQDRTLLDNLVAGSLAFEAWVKSAEGAQRIAQMWARMRELGSAAWVVIKELLDIFSQFDVSPLVGILNLLGGALKFVADNMSWINPILGVLIPLMVAQGVATKLTKKAVEGYTFVLGTSSKAMAVASIAARGLNLALGATLGALLLFTGDNPFMPTMTGIARATDAARLGFEGARKSAEEFYGYLRSQADPLFRFTEAQERYNDALNAVTEAEKTYGKNSPQYQQALLDAAQANLDLDDAAKGAADTLTEEMIDAMDLTAEQADILRQKLAEAKAEADRLEGEYNVVINTRYNDTSYGGTPPSGGNQPRNSPIYMHDGGVVPGPKGREVAAVLQGGEMVVPFDQVGRQVATPATPTTVVLEVRSGGSQVDDFLTELIRKVVRVKGRGSVQVAFGTAGR